MIVLTALVGAVLVVIAYIKLRYYTLGPHPGTPPELLFGSLRQSGIFTGTSLPTALLRTARQYGDVFEYFMGSMRVLYLAHPKYVQHIAEHRDIYDSSRRANSPFKILFPNGIINLAGAQHRTHVRIIYPLLKRGNVTPFVPHMLDCVDITIARWRDRAHNGTVRACTTLVADFAELSLRIGTAVVFNDVSDVGTDTLIAQLSVLLRYFNSVVLAPVPAELSRCVLHCIPEYRRAAAYLSGYIRDIYNNTEYTRAAESSTGRGRPIIYNLINEVRHGTITESEMADELKMLLFGSYETTSTTLSWFAVYTAQHPRVQAKIRRECELHEITRSTVLTPELLNKLRYTEAVIRETLRLAPITPGITREALRDDIIVDIPVRKGDIVGVPFYVMHMDPRFWNTDPTVFTPERFVDYNMDAASADELKYTDGVDAGYNMHTFGAFGSGHRQCAGQQLALLELRAIVCKLMIHMTFSMSGDVSVGERQGITVVPIDFKIDIHLQD